MIFMKTKDKIFDVALDLFSKNGYDSVSVRKIASEVGIKESSIYNHYSSKKEILILILDYFKEHFKDDSLHEENRYQLLEKNPIEFYHTGSTAFKELLIKERILKILKLIFVQMYQVDEIKEFFSEEILEKPLAFWSEVFGVLIRKNIIRDTIKPEKLAEMYYSFPIFKLWEMFVEYDKFPENEINTMFDEVEEYHKFLINSLRVD